MRHAHAPARSRRTLIFFALLTLFAPAAARAQQPFYTDDTDVTPRGQIHFEFGNQFGFLQRSSFPNLRQNSASFELGYGLFENVEVSIEAPLLAIFNAPGTSPPRAVGVGDTNLAAKYNFRRERENSQLPAMSVSFNVEVPTGDTARQLGSGIADFSFNAIAQKSLSDKWKLRLNCGTIFSGNTLTGAVGLRARGTVFTGGASVVREFTPRLALGAEITGALARNADPRQRSVADATRRQLHIARRPDFRFRNHRWALCGQPAARSAHRHLGGFLIQFVKERSRFEENICLSRLHHFPRPVRRMQPAPEAVRVEPKI